MEQTVVETNEQESPASEENSAQELDSLLNQYEQETKPAKDEKPKQEQVGQSDEVIARINQMEYERDMPKAVEMVRGDLDSEKYDYDLVETWIEKEAKLDRRISDAWINRKVNPTGFNKVMKALGKKFTEKYGEKTRVSGDEIESAVRNSTQTTSTPQSYEQKVAGMTDHEFRQHKRELGLDG